MMRSFIGVAIVVFIAVSAVAGSSSWTSGGPCGGTIWAIAVDPSTAAVVYAATEGGLFKSTDSGASWVLLTNAPKGTTIATIVIHPTTTSTLFIGTIERGVWKSINGGSTWTAVYTGCGDAVLALAIDPNATSTVYAGCDKYGIRRSTNGGTNWSWSFYSYASSVGALPVYSLAIDPRNSNVYAAFHALDFDGIINSSEDDIYKFDGTTWSPISSGLTENAYGAPRPWDLEVDSSTNPSTIYVATDFQIAKLTAGGTTWTNLSSTPAFSVAINPAAPATIVAGTQTNILRSTNGGASWSPASTGLQGTYFGALSFDRTATPKLYAGNNLSLFRSTDAGATWNDSNSGLCAPTIEAFVYHSATQTLRAFNRDATFSSTDGGATWTRLANSSSNYAITSISVSGTTTYSGMWVSGCRYWGGGGYLAKSGDGGASWSTPQRIVTDAKILSVGSPPANSSIVYAVTNGFGTGIVKSTNGGTSFSRISGYLQNPGESGPIIFHPTDQQTFYVGGGDGLYKSTDGGSSLTLLQGVNDGTTGYKTGPQFEVSGVAMDPSNSQHIIAGTIHFVHETMDGGATWRRMQITGNPSGDLTTFWRTTGVVFDSTTPATVYVSSRNYGVYRSTDGGQTWASYNTGLPSNAVQRLTMVGTIVHAGMFGGGVYSRDKQTSTLAAPTVTAIATSTSSIDVSWNAVTGASQYDVEFAEGAGAFQPYITTGATGITHPGRLANTCYRYRVAARDSSGAGPFSAPDLTTTVVFTDANIVARSTVIKAVHLTQLLTAINAVRTAAGAGAITLRSLAGTTVLASDIDTLRQAVSSARTTLGFTTSFTDATLAARSTTRAVHLTDLRNAVK